MTDFLSGFIFREGHNFAYLYYRYFPIYKQYLKKHNNNLEIRQGKRAKEKRAFHGIIILYDFPNHYVKQQYLPDGMEHMKFYEPTENGYEKQIADWLEFLHSQQEDEKV